MKSIENNKLYVETYGCQMNLSDSEIVQGLMQDVGYELVHSVNDANIVLINTCSIREHAEKRVIQRIKNLSYLSNKQDNFVLGVIGCMAERLKENLYKIDNNIDLVLGPDEYRKLPEYITNLKRNNKISDTHTDSNYLETYDDIIPYRSSTISAWIPIMRGCNNYCSYCVVPYTRGSERSRAFSNILNDAGQLLSDGFKEIFLLGQNVNSYYEDGKDFADLLSEISKLKENMRVRFMTSHPKDLSDKLIKIISENQNICKSIHLPFQSGSNRILELMNRNYTREIYLNLISKIKEAIPEVGISTDIIVGYPTETDSDFEDTIDLLETIQFDNAFMFKYSPREGTPAYNMCDDVSIDTKSKRLEEIIRIQKNISFKNNKNLIGKNFLTLVESSSKKNNEEYQGRLDNNKVVVFPKGNSKPGDFVSVNISSATSATLIGKIE